MATKLGEEAVGSIVKIKVDGAFKNFVVVQQGNPNTDLYDSSCNGTWLLMQNIYEKRAWHSSRMNNYASSDIHSYLNSTFYNLIDANVRNAIKQVKIPYRDGNGTYTGVASGSDGLSTKIFLLGVRELGGMSPSSYAPRDGSVLSAFSGAGADWGAEPLRVATFDGTAISWWLRSPCTYSSSTCPVYLCDSDGGWGGCDVNVVTGIRPAFILPSELVVYNDGTIGSNNEPTVITDGAALGEKTAAFAWKYTVGDADGDTLTVTEKLDGKTTKTRTGVTSGTALTFEQAADAAGFQKILNGSHTLTVEVSDGKETTSTSATFTKAVHAASVTLAEPMAVDGDIAAAVLQVTGSIPDDAVFKAEVTNNANDAAPVWQDATTEVQNGTNIVFANSNATNGAAFNFRVSVERGSSGEGGYIEAVSGAFQ